jgi:hypothetical protein
LPSASGDIRNFNITGFSATLTATEMGPEGIFFGSSAELEKQHLNILY